MRIRSIISFALKVISLGLFGLLVFVVTVVLLYNKTSKKGYDKLRYTEQDSCVFLYEDILINEKHNSSVYVYLETNPCASCSEKAILDVAYYLQDIEAGVKPYLIFHPLVDIESDVVEDYHNRYDDTFNVLVTENNIIRELNPWLPERLGFYGIVTDSTGYVKYAGFLFDSDFFSCCSELFSTNRKI